MTNPSSLQFGTSGLRGLALDLDSRAAFDWTLAFLRLAIADGTLAGGSDVLVGRDLRPSSPSICGWVYGAIVASGLHPRDCGVLPTPALALAAMTRGVPAVMVTGSHIPYDRNGLKFYLPTGEIDKADEAAITAAHAQLADGAPAASKHVADGDPRALSAYRQRYADVFGTAALNGLRLGVWEHTSVARDLLKEVLAQLGATVVGLGRTDSFVPIDTEALSPETHHQLSDWAREYGFDAIVSTDGDGDRPLIADETGAALPGDLVGAITARALGADSIVTPVTANSALEACGRFATVVRTRVGSPFVIAGLAQAHGTVVGFEANGGVLLGSDYGNFRALPTRDALLPIIACLSTAVAQGLSISAIGADFGFRATQSTRIEAVPAGQSARFLAALQAGDLDSAFSPMGGIVRRDDTDGVQLQLGDGGLLHFRASGNAPELRVYAQAPGAEQVAALIGFGLSFAREHTSERLGGDQSPG